MGTIDKFAWDPPRLDGARVLVVEDEFLIALEIAAIMTEAGAIVVGPAGSMPDALALADEAGLSVAVLDMRLGSASIAPVAHKLADHGIPFIFYTGQTKGDPVQAEWPDCQVVSKPASSIALLNAVAALLEEPARVRIGAG